jgi:radical SAM protein with 4Fe4S-binding SPASM domain
VEAIEEAARVREPIERLRGESARLEGGMGEVVAALVTMEEQEQGLARHQDALQRAREATARGRDALRDGVTLELAAGDLFGFIGPNGSGKTTTVNLITGFVKAKRVFIGFDVPPEKSFAFHNYPVYLPVYLYQTHSHGLALEHNGDLYACDHFVEPKYLLGNIQQSHLLELVASEPQRTFGRSKLEALPRSCRECEVWFACKGECPKNRFLTTPEGEPGLNYLCAGYKRFFHHVEPYMKEMAQLLAARQPAALIMDAIRQRETAAKWANVTRNDPCPCGSGKKYKACCAGKEPAHGR